MANYERFRVEVFCDDHHPNNKVTKVDVFILHRGIDSVDIDADLLPGVRGDWGLVPSSGVRLDENNSVIPEPTGIREAIAYGAGPASRARRHSWDLRCKYCGLRKRANREKLEPFLIKCAEAGESRVPLAWLVANL